jgi:hypothetical protein
LNIAFKNLPLRFLYAGLIYLVIGAIAGVLNIQGYGLKGIHSHLMLAGFVSLTIVGAMYQLVPTILGNELKLRKLAEASFILLNFGLLALIYSFIYSFSLMVPAAGIYTAGAISFAASIYATVLTAPRKNVSIAVWFFSIAIIYYLAGIIYAALAFSGVISFRIPVHSHLLAVGWVSLTTYGGLYELFPMLSLRKLKSVKLAYFNLLLTNAALIGMLYGFYLSKEVLLYSGVVFAASFYLLAANLFATLATQSESGAELDISVKFFVPALLFGLAGITLGPLNVAGSYTFQHSHLLLLGWITLTIIGAEYHIIPMLTWMEKYASKLGVEDVPMIADLFSMKLGKAVLAGSIAGVALLAYSATAPIGGIILLATFLAFAGDMVAVQFR